jgi:hypothetical protein
LSSFFSRPGVVRKNPFLVSRGLFNGALPNFVR